MTRRLWLAAALALLLGGCGKGKPASDAGVTIGYQKSGILFVAQSRGVLAQRLAAQGIAPVRWVEFPSGPPLVEAMRAGAVDIGAVGDTPVAYAQASGFDIVYVATHRFPADVVTSLIVPTTSSIRSAADLRGKRLAFVKGSASEVAAIIALKQAGLTLKDVKPVYLAPGDAMTAFANGAIDAWLIWDPYLTQAQERIGARVVPIDRAGIAAINFYIARGQWAKRHPRQLVAILDALRDEAAWARGHQDEVVTLLAKATRLPEPVQRRVLAHYGREPFAVNPIAAADIANQQRISDALVRAGVLGRPIDAGSAAWRVWTPKR